MKETEPVICPACGFETLDYLILATHIRARHLGLHTHDWSIYLCWCGMEFMHVDNFAGHLQEIDDLEIHYILESLAR